MGGGAFHDGVRGIQGAARFSCFCHYVLTQRIKEYRKRNREQVNEYQRTYRQRNKNYQQYQLEYRQNNEEDIKEYQKKYHEEHKAEYQVHKRKYDL